MHEVLAAWGVLEVVGPVGGGNRNTVLELRRGGARLAARQSRRSPASLDWQIDLLDHLTRHGLRVPAIIPSADSAATSTVSLSSPGSMAPRRVRVTGQRSPPPCTACTW